MLHRRRDQAHAGLIAAALAGGLAVATPAAAEIRFIAFDPADDLTRALTRGITLEIDRGWFGRVDVRRLWSTTSRGSAGLDKAGAAQARAVLPTGADQRHGYRIEPEGDGRALARALCPGADQTWLVMDKPRLARPLTIHAVGRWADGQWRHCAELSYRFRGEWADPPRDDPARDAPLGG